MWWRERREGISCHEDGFGHTHTDTHTHTHTHTVTVSWQSDAPGITEVFF